MSNKTIASMIYDAEVRINMWKGVAEDSVALEDRNMTFEEAMCLVSYSS